MQTFDLPGAGLQPTAVGFSPDGRALAVWGHSSVFVADLLAGEVRTLWAAPPPPDTAFGMGTYPDVGFTADGAGVVARHTLQPDRGRRATELRVYARDTGAVLRRLPVDEWSAVEIGPGGRWVYAATYASGRVGVTRWDPLTGRKLPAFGRYTGDLCQIAVSRDERLVLGSRWDEARLWNLGTGKPPARASKQLWVKKGLRINALALSADGAWAAARAGEVSVWDVPTGKRRVMSKVSAPGGRGVTFHPARPVLASTEGDAVVFHDAPAKAELKRYLWNVGPLTAVAFSADGLKCAAAGAGKVVVWDVDV